MLVHNTCSKPTNRKQLAKPAVSDKQVPNKGINSFSEQFDYGMNQLKKYGDVTSTENVYMFRQFRH